MRFIYVPMLALVLVSSLCSSQSDPVPEPDIVLPEVSPVAPSPAPTPAITKLSAAELYVISAKEPLIVLASPEGIVSITEETGPMKVRALFAGNTRYSTRQIKGPAIYFVEAVATGRVELLITRADPKNKNVIRRTLDVTAEPGPGPGPGPTPPGPTPPGPLPDGTLGLIKASRDGLAKVTVSTKAVDAAKLAKAQRGIASAIAAGGVSQPAAILAAWREANRATVDGAAWKPWGETVSAALSKLYADGKLPDKSAWVAAFTEIAEGLEGK